MIAFLTGKIKFMGSENIILDVNGVGYEVQTSTKTHNQLSVSNPIELWIYTHVREDTLKLYGFLSLLEKKLFLSFIGINGVGPKMALSILSTVPSLEELVDMIERSDAKRLSQLPRVGKKTAQQMIFSLRGQLKETWMQVDQDRVKSRQDLSATLKGLGFRSIEIQAALEHIQLGQNTENNLKEALSYLQSEGPL